MAEKKRGWLKKLGKLSIAILEHKVEDVIGDKAIEILKAEYSEQTALITALAHTEERFRLEFEDEEIIKALFDDLSLEGLPSLEAAFSEFYARPTAPSLPAKLNEIISNDLSTLTAEQVDTIVTAYLDIFIEELAIQDQDFLRNIVAIFQLRSGRDTHAMREDIGKIAEILKRIEERTGKVPIPFDEGKYDNSPEPISQSQPQSNLPREPFTKNDDSILTPTEWKFRDTKLLLSYFESCAKHDTKFLPHQDLNENKILEYFLSSGLARTADDGKTYLTLSGILLCCRSENIPRDYLHVHVKLRDRTKSGRKRFNLELSASILEVYYELYEKLMPLWSTRIGSPDVRDDQGSEIVYNEYPQRAIEEALVNFLIHRDYTIDDIGYITVYKDRVEFKNPGKSLIPIEILLDETRNIGIDPKYHRNPRLIEAMSKARFNQRDGEGILQIRKALEENETRIDGKLGLEIIIDEDQDRFILTIFKKEFLKQDMAKKSSEEVILDTLSTRHQLTPPPADFVGRAEELDELRRMIRGKGATITGLRGMGGIGKTALARVIAQELKDDYPDAQIELDLEGITKEALTPENALAYVIHSFHPGADLPDDRAQLEAIYRSTLQGKRALLLMDNARDAAQVEPLLPPEGSLLLVTSRKRFTLAGLEPLELGVMDESEAIGLLTTISARAEDHAAQIAELCDYLPLALRLAASALNRRGDLTPERYIERLQGQRLKTLDLTADETEERPGVAASLQLSYDLLTKDLQQLWRGLAVFPKEFDAHAALYITKGLEDTNALIERKGAETILDETGDQLADLVGYSLLEYDPESRRYRLHDLGREFADVKLEQADEKDASWRRHAQYYLSILAMADDLYLQGDQNVLAGLSVYDLEAANIQAGQSWAAQQMKKDKTAAELAANYPDAGAFILSLRLHVKDRINWLETSLTAARQIGDRHGQGTALGNLGGGYHAIGDYEKAIDFHQQALGISRQIGNRKGEGTTLGNLGAVYDVLGDYNKAIDFHQQALAISREIGDRRGQGSALGNLGGAYHAIGDYEKAIDFRQQALDISREIGDRRAEGQDLGNLGNTYFALGDYNKAIDFHRQALVISREIGDRLGEGQDLGNLGSTYQALGKTQQAVEFQEQRLQIAQEIGDRRGEGAAFGNLGVAYFALGDYPKAIKFYQQALDISRQIGNYGGEGAALGNLGVAFWERGQREQAITYTVQAFLLFDQLGIPQARQALRELSQRAAEMGAKAFQTALAQSGLPGEAQQAVLQALEQAEQEQPDLRQVLVANTIGALTSAQDKKEEWLKSLGQIQDQVKDEEEAPGLVVYLGLLRRLVKNADPAALARDVPEEFKADWGEIEKGLKESK